MSDIPSCVDLQKVSRLNYLGLSEEKVTELSQHFALLGDANRLKIILALEKEECCVHELSLVTNLSISALSHQLRKLKDGGLVQSRKDGTVRYYRLSLNTFLDQLACFVSEAPIINSPKTV